MANYNIPLKEKVRQRKKDVIMKVKKLGEMTTLYKILAKIEERIRINPWDKAYALNNQLSPYDMVLMVISPMIYPRSERRLRAYFTAWKRLINEERKKQR